MVADLYSQTSNKHKIWGVYELFNLVSCLYTLFNIHYFNVFVKCSIFFVSFKNPLDKSI